jgi:hypothetical protein
MKKLSSFSVLFLCIAFTYGAPTTKSSGSANSPSSTLELMRMNVYGYNSDGSTFLVDGTVTQYGSQYSNDIDGYDGRKMTNPGANVCLVRDNINLVVERRQIIGLADTIFFKMWGLQKASYEMRFVAVNLDHPGLEAYLEDNYLHTSTPVQLNDTTHINIDINNDAGSYALNRFRLIYKTPSSAVHFTAIEATAGEGQVFVNWQTESESNTNSFFIQKSLDGLHFFDAGSVSPYHFSAGNYQWTDRFPFDQYNYYRIKSMEANGQTAYSEIVKVKAPSPKNKVSLITLYPNPVTGNNINLNMVNQPAGKYKLRLFNSFGQVIIVQTFNFQGGTAIQKMNINQSIQHGIYNLQVLKPTGDNELIELIY